jgi:hypothetical protein
VAVFVTVVASILNLSTGALGSGEDSSGREDDIRLNADWRWAGGHQGGYYPIRISLQNAGRPRTIDVAFRSNSSGLPTVSRRVIVDQNASATFSLLVPLVGENSFGELQVRADGRELQSLSIPISLPSPGWGDCPFAVLAFSDTPVLLPELETAVASLHATGGHTGYGGKPCDLEHLEPVRLPDSWLAYSGVDLLVTSIEILEKLDGLQRKAITDWTLAGGCLALYSADKQDTELRQSIDALVNARRSPASAGWQPVPLKLRRTVDRVEIDEYGNRTSTHPGHDDDFKWPANEETLQVRRHGLGRLVTLPAEPFNGTYQDWAWLFNGIQFRQQVFPTRLGVSGRQANQEFLEFLIPGVRSVPVIAFVIVISLFAILIGPVNYYALAKRKRQGFLVVTIPTIALFCSLAMFAYSFVAHGVSVRSRVRSVTWVDQEHQTAVSMARIAWFAGFAPSDGLTLPTSTAFIPIWHQDGGFGNGSVDWTESQHLAAGFLRSRTRTQALTIDVRDERGRLAVKQDSSSGDAAASLNVTSGLEWPLEALIVWDDDGNAYSTGSVAPGQAVTLSRLTDDPTQSFQTLLKRSAPGIPDELRVPAGDFFDMGSAWNHGDGNAVSRGQMERAIIELSQGIKTRNPAFARRYAAIATEPPGIEFGTDVTIVDGWHLVIGEY